MEDKLLIFDLDRCLYDPDPHREDTWNDFWNITLQIHPVAIISFGAGDGPWEIEYSTRNLEFWINDENPPYQPTPSPPDDTVPAGFIRHSTLPLQEIADAVNSQTDIEAWVDWDGFAGMYLCEYIGYLGMWYQSLHSGQGDLYPCRRMPVRVGNVLETKLIDLYYKSDFFCSLRNHEQAIEGCRGCPHFKKCHGGLKCLSYALTGHPFNTDPGCWLADAGVER